MKARYFIHVFNTSLSTHHASWYMCTSKVTGNWDGHNLHPQPFQNTNLLSNCVRAQNPLQVVPNICFFLQGRQRTDSNMAILASPATCAWLTMVLQTLHSLSSRSFWIIPETPRLVIPPPPRASAKQEPRIVSSCSTNLAFGATPESSTQPCYQRHNKNKQQLYHVSNHPLLQCVHAHLHIPCHLGFVFSFLLQPFGHSWLYSS